MHIIERVIKALIRAGGPGAARRSPLFRAICRPFGAVTVPRLRPPLDLAFWAAFILLHALLVLPVVLMNRENGAVLPTLQLAGRSFDQVWRHLLLWRSAPDLLRFNSEIVLFIGLWTMLPALRRAGVRRGFVAAYLFFFAYYLYEGASLTFFSVEPVFYSQFRMATEGFSFFLQNARVTVSFVAATVLLIVAGAIVVARLARFALPQHGPTLASRILLALLSLLIIAQAYTHRQHIGRPQMVFSSLAVKLAHNLTESLRVYGNVKRFDSAKVHLAYDYSGYSLAQRPPVYIVFIESYGSVLYKRTDWSTRYRALTQRLEQELANAGWHVASARSLAPTWGGGSWMSYTSALFGLRVSSDPQYYALLDKYQLEQYPDLGRFLKAQGYRYYRLTALSMGLPQSAWKKYVDFFGVDRWILYEDLNFAGPEYGWGPAPPDQFSLHFARETMRRDTDAPFLFFTITQNSHYPWTPLPAMTDNWRALNLPGEAPQASSELIEHSERRQNYWNAIEYQLEMLTEFILSEPNEQAIFVLVGDHQPPRVSRAEDGWDTPFHIIAKNGNFVASFREFGFESGLAVWESDPTFRHEGFYSLFVRQLLDAFGSGGELPPYLPDGVSFEEEPRPPSP